MVSGKRGEGFFVCRVCFLNDFACFSCVGTDAEARNSSEQERIEGKESRKQLIPYLLLVSAKERLSESKEPPPPPVEK